MINGLYFWCLNVLFGLTAMSLVHDMMQFACCIISTCQTQPVISFMQSGKGWLSHYNLDSLFQGQCVGLCCSLSAGLCCSLGAGLCCSLSAGLCCSLGAGLCCSLSAGLRCSLSAGLCCSLNAGLCCSLSTGLCCSLSAGLRCSLSAGLCCSLSWSLVIWGWLVGCMVGGFGSFFGSFVTYSWEVSRFATWRKQCLIHRQNRISLVLWQLKARVYSTWMFFVFFWCWLHLVIAAQLGRVVW